MQAASTQQHCAVATAAQQKRIKTERAVVKREQVVVAEQEKRVFELRAALAEAECLLRASTDHSQADASIKAEPATKDDTSLSRRTGGLRLPCL